MAVFLANVGANAAHRVRSPLRADGSFVLHPIPEREPWAPPMRRMPGVWGDLAVHLDPDLGGEPPTYGDNCRTAGRAFSLRRAEPGDLLVFVARLHPDGGAGPPGFYLVGALVVAEVKPDLTADPGPGWWDGNAHVLRARATGDAWNSFWVFRGEPGPSRLFDRAVPFRRQEADAVFDRAWRWADTRTELQTIGSCTRAVRRLTGAGERRLRELLPTHVARGHA
jgi:Nucleotide modification associated domain 3